MPIEERQTCTTMAPHDRLLVEHKHFKFVHRSVFVPHFQALTQIGASTSVRNQLTASYR